MNLSWMKMQRALIAILILGMAGAAIAGGIWFAVKRPSEQPTGAPADQQFEWVSDITPGSGKGTGPPGAQDGPWNHRVMGATSNDGLTWAKDDRILADQASVPDAIVDNNGDIRVYYVDWFNGHVISVALSHDGDNWIYKKVTIEGEAAGSQTGISPMDPDIVLLPDGRYRLYYMYGGEIRSAVSNYGINFVKEEGVRFQEGGYTWMDPDVVKIGDVWRMFVWRMVTSTTNQVISAVSSDGISFTKENVLTTGSNISCTIPVEGGYRMYYVDAGIRSAFSSDGVSWSGEGLRLDGAADPTVIKEDGTYKMFYKTWIEQVF